MLIGTHSYREKPAIVLFTTIAGWFGGREWLFPGLEIDLSCIQ